MHRAGEGTRLMFRKFIEALERRRLTRILQGNAPFHFTGPTPLVPLEQAAIHKLQTGAPLDGDDRVTLLLSVLLASWMRHHLRRHIMGSAYDNIIRRMHQASPW